MSSVINLHREGAIAVVTMEEKEWGNTFTKRFKNDLMTTFEHIALDESLKVVVIQGYDPYFCCGGTQ
jgi:polyketide biosynthesis enoyl-CoA hydratase PksI